jgi:hypothetical protein
MPPPGSRVSPPPDVITLPSGRSVFIARGVYEEPRLLSAKPLPSSAWHSPWSQEDRRALAAEMHRRWDAWASERPSGVPGPE